MGEEEIKPPECVVSYAWGVPEHERWVEKRLATDLQKAGIGVGQRGRGIDGSFGEMQVHDRPATQYGGGGPIPAEYMVE